MPLLPRRTSVAAAACALLLTSPALAGPPTNDEERAALVGQPTAIEVVPAAVKLAGVRDARQLVVTGKYADGSARDLTAVATLKTEASGVVDIQDGGFLRPKKNGSATLAVSDSMK